MRIRNQPKACSTTAIENMNIYQNGVAKMATYVINTRERKDCLSSEEAGYLANNIMTENNENNNIESWLQ